jgi:SAM-dependent methyltransferase
VDYAPRDMAAADLVPEIIRSRAEYEAAHARGEDRRAYERFLEEAYAPAERWGFPGICQACDQVVGLIVDKHYGGGGNRINFRERLECPNCRLNNRQRFMAWLVRTVLAEQPPGAAPRTYLHEQVTPFFAWAQRALPGEVLGSEYLGHDVPGGSEINGVRHEDALALSFGDTSLDIIISTDVLEHVPEIEPAIAEAGRVLRPGGRFLFSLPFKPGLDVSVQRAQLRDGEVVHLHEPQFHGNPVSAEGSLVFWDHGWDLLDRLHRHGFANAHLVGYWSALYGYLGGGLQVVFAATRD